MALNRIASSRATPELPLDGKCARTLLHRRSAWLFGLLLLILPACSGPHPPPSIAFADFPDALARRICEVQAQCNPPSWFEMDGCVVRQRASMEMDYMRATLEAVPLGVVLYDGEAAAACLAAISCDKLSTNWVAFFSEYRDNRAALEAPNCAAALSANMI